MARPNTPRGLRSRRLRMKMTLRTLGAIIPVSAPTLMRWENGAVIPRYKRDRWIRVVSDLEQMVAKRKEKRHDQQRSANA